MIDTKELRRLTQAALAGPDGVSLHWVKLLQDFQQEANPVAISELLDRLEAAESECLEEARLNGMGASREAALMAKLEAAEKERDALRAKIEAMEKQEPVGRFARIDGDGPLMECKHADIPSVPLYSLPGAQTQPAASVPSDEYVGWYCAHCERGVDASEVTYHEQHQACGRVITDDRPPRHSPSVPDSILADAARYRFLRNGGAYLEPNEGEIYMATDYGAKYYKDLRDLDMDIDEALAAAPETKS